MKKRGKDAEVHLAKWISVEHREEVHEKVQRKTKRPRKDGGLQRMRRGLPMKQQAVRIVSTHQEEFFVAVDSNLGAAVGVEEGAIESIPDNEGRIAQAWVNVRGGLRLFSVYFWHSEGWTFRKLCWKQFCSKQQQPDTRR